MANLQKSSSAACPIPVNTPALPLMAANQPFVSFHVAAEPRSNRIMCARPKPHDDRHRRIAGKPFGLHHGSRSLWDVAVGGFDFAAGVKPSSPLDGSPWICLECR